MKHVEYMSYDLASSSKDYESFRKYIKNLTRNTCKNIPNDLNLGSNICYEDFIPCLRLWDRVIIFADMQGWLILNWHIEDDVLCITFIEPWDIEDYEDSLHATLDKLPEPETICVTHQSYSSKFQDSLTQQYTN